MSLPAIITPFVSGWTGISIGSSKVGAGGGPIVCRGAECLRGDNGICAVIGSLGKRSDDLEAGTLESLMSEWMKRV